jgi:hypothetical protein
MVGKLADQDAADGLAIAGIQSYNYMFSHVWTVYEQGQTRGDRGGIRFYDRAAAATPL